MGKTGKKLRCGHCHLTINEEELETDFCPECWESEKIRRRNFEEIIKEDSDTDQYRCEKCGILVVAPKP
jgi:predicted RNA-binding Zn-ribbon protein involved in translation (DUF1610 family)